MSAERGLRLLLRPRQPLASQRGANKDTNGLLRPRSPKTTGLATHSREHLDAVAAELNSRPRKTLGRETPAERLPKPLAA